MTLSGDFVPAMTISGAIPAAILVTWSTKCQHGCKAGRLPLPLVAL